MKKTLLAILFMFLSLATTVVLIVKTEDESDYLAYAQKEVVAIAHYGRPSTVTNGVILKATDFNNPNPSVNIIKEYIRQKFGSNADTAECIASHESNFRVRAIGYNPPSALTGWQESWDKGIFQLNSYWHPLPDSLVYSWKDNIDIAYQISNHGQHWDRWSTKHFCI